jgi:hypothetical protein
MTSDFRKKKQLLGVWFSHVSFKLIAFLFDVSDVKLIEELQCSERLSISTTKSSYLRKEILDARTN